MSRAALALAMLALPAVAMARCPGSDDISAGIVHGYVDAAGQEVLDVAFGTTSYLATYYELGAFGLTRQRLMLKGVYPLAVTTIVSDEVVTTAYDYGVVQAAFPAPAPGVSWQVEVSVTRGGAHHLETQGYTFGAAEERAIGACSYRVIPYDILTDSPERPPGILRMFHVPVLGVSFPDPRRDSGTGDGADMSRRAERMTTYPDLLAEWGN